ncbi:T9SS type A sorting domain-containing protein, partial [candidate division KSB1 bacterium]
SGTWTHLTSVCFTSPDTGWVVGYNNTILRTVDGGDSWMPQSDFPFGDKIYRFNDYAFWDDAWHAVFFSDAKTGWIVGNYGNILKTRDGGINWRVVYAGTQSHLRSVFFADANNGWLFGDDGIILFTDEGELMQVQGFAAQTAALPERPALGQNYPNPFNSMTKIEFSLPTSSHVSLKLYNLLGEEIATLFDDRTIAGNYAINFNAENLPSGFYLYSLQADGFSASKKLTLQK